MARVRLSCCLAYCCWLSLGSPAALAQTAPPAAQPGGRALEQAGDAFGVRIGAEQIGLYSEGQVRGLSLQDAGNYRLGGAYFVRAGNLVDPILAGVTIRVGFNALEADFPAPTGLVEYRLKSPLDAPLFAGEVAAREYGGRFVEAIASLPIAQDRAGLLIGGQANLARSSAGFQNNGYRIGAIGEWRPSESARLLGFGSLNLFNLEGAYGVTATGDALPPPMPHPRRYLPHWGDHDGRDLNAGVIGSVEAAGRLTLTGSAIYSRLDLDEADFVNLHFDPRGKGHAIIVSNRPRKVESWAAAAGASWDQSPGRRLFAELRFRDTRTAFAPGAAQRIEGIDIDFDLPPAPEPRLDDLVPTVDRARQVVAGVGYEANFSRLWFKGSLQRAFYDRTFSPPGLPSTQSRESPWLYDVSAAAALSDRLTAFASLTRGIEESGVAPGNAVNRNEVLPAVIATQQEIGLRGRIGTDLTLIASAFSIKKPAPSFDAEGFYRLAGDLRHRGIELSLSGHIAPRLRLLAGALLLDTERSGELVELGTISKRVPGTSSIQALAGLSWQVPWVEGFSLDGQLSYFGPRLVRSAGNLETAGFATVDIGALHNFNIGETDLALRLRVLNLFDSDAWIAGRSELLDRVSRRGVRLSLSVRI